MANHSPVRSISTQNSPFNLKILSKRLGGVEHFRNLSSAQRDEIVTAGQIEHHPKDSLIFREGDPSAGLFVLFKGKV